MSASLLGLAWAAKVGDSKTRKLVLMKLVDCCDDEGSNIWPSLQTVADHVGCSTQQVRRELKRFCAIGLLRKVRDGGRGAGSTASYAMDIDLLARLRRPDTWKVMEAAALHDPLPDSDDDDERDHAPVAEQAAEPEASDASVEDDMVSPLHSYGRVTSEAGRVTSGVTQPLNRTLNEREGVRAHEDTPASEGEPVPAPTFDDFLDAYPHARGDNRVKQRSAWEAVPFGERRAAIDGIGAFIAERRAGGLKRRLASEQYLLGRNWIGLEAKAAARNAAQAAGAPVTFDGWTTNWWLLLLDRAISGKPLGFWMAQAEARKPFSATQAEIAAAVRRVGELKPFVCTGPELAAWRPWLAAKGARIPVFEGYFRVFLPSETPPGGRRDEGDDDVRL